MLQLLALLIVQGFILEALRIHASDDPWHHYSFVGFGLSSFFWGLSTRVCKNDRFWSLVVSFCNSFCFYCAYSLHKVFHIISSSLNLFFTELEKPKGKLPFIGDIEKLMEEAMSSATEDFSLGIGKLNDLDWKRD